MKTWTVCGCTEIYANVGRDIVLKSMCYDCLKERKGTVIDFIRFGKAPEVSYNYAENRNENGVSVYLIENNTVCQTMRSEFLDRTAYIGTGLMVDTGGDDEPVVEIQSIKKASLKQLKKLGLK